MDLKLMEGRQNMTNISLKNLMRSLTALLGIVLLTIAFGCSKSGSELVGTWDNVKAPEVVEFKQDGTGIFLYPNTQNPPLTFKWKQTADKSYSIDVNYMGSIRILTGTLKDKALRLESNMGVEVYNKRATR